MVSIQEMLIGNVKEETEEKIDIEKRFWRTWNIYAE